MESVYTELALYGSNNECARTDTAFLPISEVCNVTVSLSKVDTVNTSIHKVIATGTGGEAIRNREGGEEANVDPNDFDF